MASHEDHSLWDDLMPHLSTFSMTLPEGHSEADEADSSVFY